MRSQIATEGRRARRSAKSASVTDQGHVERAAARAHGFHGGHMRDAEATAGAEAGAAAAGAVVGGTAMSLSEERVSGGAVVAEEKATKTSLEVACDGEKDDKVGRRVHPDAEVADGEEVARVRHVQSVQHSEDEGGALQHGERHRQSEHRSRGPPHIAELAREVGFGTEHQVENHDDGGDGHCGHRHPRLDGEDDKVKDAEPVVAGQRGVEEAGMAQAGDDGRRQEDAAEGEDLAPAGENVAGSERLEDGDAPADGDDVDPPVARDEPSIAEREEVDPGGVLEEEEAASVEPGEAEAHLGDDQDADARVADGGFAFDEHEESGCVQEEGRCVQDRVEALQPELQGVRLAAGVLCEEEGGVHAGSGLGVAFVATSTWLGFSTRAQPPGALRRLKAEGCWHWLRIRLRAPPMTAQLTL